ncbi:MAG: hypothetical protein U0X91_26975 [Spirosomataceae bacterium]
MAFARRIQNPEELYFITFATVQWVDVFTPRLCVVFGRTLRTPNK